jgi:hypothetical protein
LALLGRMGVGPLGAFDVWNAWKGIAQPDLLLLMPSCRGCGLRAIAMYSDAILFDALYELLEFLRGSPDMGWTRPGTISKRTVEGKHTRQRKPGKFSQLVSSSLT